MAKLYCAVLFAVGWTLVLATITPLTTKEKIANCKKHAVENKGNYSKIDESESYPCKYACLYNVSLYESYVFLETDYLNYPDGLHCGLSMDCHNGACLDKRAIEMCRANMSVYAEVSDDGNCFIKCSNRGKDVTLQAPKGYPCEALLVGASVAACDEKGRCITVRDDVIANVQNFPRNNDARAFADCTTRYTNGALQYGEKHLELTGASSYAEYTYCFYICLFTNMTDQTVVEELYYFSDYTICTNITDPNAEEKVCVYGSCQSKELYDACNARGFIPQYLNSDDCIIWCNFVDISNADQGKPCKDAFNNNGVCDGQGNCQKSL